MKSVKEILEKQKEYFSKGETKSVKFRIQQLQKLKKVIENNEEAITHALKKDLNKPKFEAYETEIGIVLEEIRFTIKHIRRWAKPQRVKTPITHFISKSYVVSEPHGITLIMSPWNYPFQLAIAPLVGSISGGNCSILKPSAFSSNTSSVMAKIIRENFNEEYIAVVEGGRAENEALLNEKFDYIFFTGSIEVGKVVMGKAAQHLTPVTLELGGKSPCIICEDANIDLAAKRAVWGKFLNAGQTCVAPDYLMVHKNVKHKFLNSAKKYIVEFYGRNPCYCNEDFPKIINEKHFNRLLGLMNSGGDIVIGGKSDEKTHKIAPTVIDNITWENDIMKEEIFGPLFPIIEFDDINEVIKVVKSHAKPLALYLFTTSKDMEHKIIESISFGGGCVNDTIVHLATSYMAFGGVGESGMGGYHGKSSFDTFTHKKSILNKSNLIDVNVRYAPYTEKKLNLMKKLL